MKSLIGGQAFVLSCKLGNNGSYTQAKSLIDTGANGTLFIQRKLACRLAELFGTSIEESVDICSATGYDGQSAQEIKQFVRLSLKLEGRAFLD
jgi:predicted aspartyl protease